MSTPLTDRINALTAYSNQKTGASDTTLSDAVTRLVTGYGGGGVIEDGIVFTELNSSGRPISADIYGDIQPYAFGYYNNNSSLGAYLKSVVFKTALKKISVGAFQKTALETLVIPDSVDVIGMQLFRGSTTLKTYIHENARDLYGYNKSAVQAFNQWTASALETLQLGAVGKPVTALYYQAFGGNLSVPATANIIIFCTGANVDTYLSDIRRNTSVKATVIFKAAEGTTYNGTSYAAGDTMLTDTSSTS